MTIAEFLAKCQTDETRLRITARGKGRVYDGTINEFKTGADDVMAKSRLASDKIYTISFDGLVSMYNRDGCGAHFEPVVIIVI